jgi:hypothetical protein
MKSLALLAGLATVVQSASAVDVGTITLFGQEYRVQRLDYAADVRWPDPLDPSFDVLLLEVEGAHWLGDDRLLLSTDAGDSQLTIKNWVVEVALVRDGSGDVTGLRYVRTVIANDPFNPAYGGFDLSPCGITINTTTSGLASNGNLLIGDSEANGVAGYDRTSGAFLGSWSGGTANNSFDDLAFAPTNGLVYTINEDGFRLVAFSPAGAVVQSTPIPGLAALNPTFIPGSPKGITYLSDAETVPASIRRAGGSFLLTLDDNNPGLQAFDLNGNLLATEALTDNPAIIGASLLDQGAGCGNPLQLESAAFDPATGTIFLINEGAFTDCSGFFVLTPISGCPCSADFDASGGTPDASDIDAFFTAWLLGEDSADADCSGGTPDASDIDTFFLQWLAGGC